ncbi:MAG: 50S ribosomal protein L21 [Buchnera aphidicola (Eriosoma harunire)]
MYAIIISGGKQYQVKQGQIIKLEKLSEEIGDKIVLKKVLMIANKNIIHIGTPYLINSSVQANIINHGKHNKINIIKFKRRKHYKKQQGHRQLFTAIKIENIIHNKQG